MLSLKQCLLNIVEKLGYDYIVEEGRVNYGTATDSSTYNYWTYRKWNSGVAECWISVGTTDWVNVSWGGGFYRSDLIHDIPFPFTFKEIPMIQRWISSVDTVHANNSGGVSLCTYSAASTTSTGQIFLTRYGSTSATWIYDNIYAIGYWKTPTLGG